MRKGSSILKIITYISVILVLLIVVIWTNKERESSVVETVLSYTVMPVQRGISYFSYWITGSQNVFPQIDDLKHENENLSKENEVLRQQLADYQLVLDENKILKEQMNLTQKYPQIKTLSSVVIADSTNNWNKILVINQGKNDGVKVGMTVISDKGLVGYIKEVQDNTSKVLCIIDSSSSVSGRVTKTKEAVVCRGDLGLQEKSQMKLMYIPTGVVLAVGDIVETSGIGGIYKKGITIGEVVEVVEANNSLESYAIVETAVDFSTLEYVLVVLE